MIGLFDSGFGGLTVLREIRERLPDYTYAYLGDSARMPYGNKTQETLYRYARQAVDFLVRQGATLIIFACNTVSSEALRRIQQEYLPEKYPALKVLGVIRPTVEKALETSKTNIIGVAATRSTVLSGAYERELKKLDTTVQVYQQACPLLVPLIEEGWEKKPETRMILKKYLLRLKSCHIDTLVLGCTHYPILESEFHRKIGQRVRIVSSATATAEKLVDYLSRHPEVEKNLERKAQSKFFTSDDPARFTALGSRFLGEQIAPRQVELVNLEGV